ncbi:tRNA glutamyl-Q(34) synthetase GluQRS [Kushneria aurantia]|uniref:Glutamyl-Q tRNA(Asp) synthetase n=1 Tax=Kushneria aurantia TaxID=504092 RepID=A0ABV6G6Z3_9GAMM|nr:tRNA glutamyl-Q(34) synthetase GluQRS [Kushneria aurantia]
MPAVMTPTGPAVVGRFAPTPSGPLHFGSLLAALASWLDARARDGRWLLRIEDIDPPRCPAGTDATIIAQLATFGLEHDGEIRYQSRCEGRYRDTLTRLADAGLAYPCSCSRRQWRDYRVYPGWCRSGVSEPGRDCAWRLRTDCGDDIVSWHDRRLGLQHWSLATLGDVILRRRDGLWAYQLAVVADDFEQGITDVVRGADLLDNTAWQILLQRSLGWPTPHYLHLPLAVADNGQKLSKQNLATALPTDDTAARALLFEALTLLAQPALSAATPIREQLDAALAGWRPDALPAGPLSHHGG